MKKKIFKRGMAGLLAVLTAFTTLIGMGTTAFAASETAESYMVSYPRDGDAVQVYDHSTWGHDAKTYMNGWSTGASDMTTIHCMDSYNGKVCYCIEPGVPRNVGDSYSGFGENFWDNYPSQYNNTIEPDDIKVLLGRIMQYGYQGNISTSWKSQTNGDVMAHNSSEDSGVKVVEVKLGNYAQKGIIKISKSGEVFATVTEADGMYQPVYEVQGLAGATYEIKAAEDVYTLDGTLRYSSGEVVDSVTTGEDGVAESKPLYLGKYEIYETEAPFGMVINTEVHSAELVYAGQEIEITETAASFCNDRQKVQISLTKVMEQNKQFGIGMNDEMSAVTFGLYAGEELTAKDSKIIPADGLVEIISVDENGKAKAKSDLPFGNYYLKEISTDQHYILTDEKFSVSFEYAGQTVDIVDIKANDGKSISNELIYGEVHGMKKDENGKALGGATIGLFYSDGKEPVLTTVSAEDGSFFFKDIPFGEYIVREIEAPEGFVMDETPYAVNIDKDGAVVEIEITNKLIRGNVQLTKVDANYPDHHLSGAEFEVYQNGELVGKMEELADGVYEMDNLPYGEYTVKETKAPEGFYLDEGTYAFSIKENGKTVIVENEAGKGFINKAQVGNIRIEKTSEDGVLKGFTFHVEGSDITGNAFSKDFVTDENGQIHIEGLRIGNYVISEVGNKANEKYVLPENVTVTVHEGKTVVAKFYNELKPVIPDVPKTGDTTNMPLWAALAGISLLGAGVAAFFTFRKKKEVGKHER